jgi:ribonucleoside-diphosphate reductase alpha chain
MSDGEFLQATVKEMLDFNALVAKRIGLNPSARMTTTKPSGSASAVAGCSSGIHAAHSEYYIRRVRIAKIDPVVEHLRTSGYPESLIEEDKFKPSDVVVAIPQAMPGAVTRDDETAIELLERMKHLTLNWIKPGHRSGDNTHNCSITVNYKSEEVEDIKAWLWENRDVYAGVSLLPFSDSTYEQAPFEAITKAQYEAMAGLIPVGIDLLGGTIGGVDERNDVSGCEGQRCEIK